ncbi:hypothetical protein V498_10387, partial [Pseudogymnoascus sp. VKM F-4517 (FW-2822)]
LRKLEWKYCIACYGIPFIPAFVYLFIETKARGKVYGSAIQWCWVRSEWGSLRIAVVFAPVWALIVLSTAIYIFAGREILKSRRRLRSLAHDSAVSSSTTQHQIDFPRTTDVAIPNEAHSAPVKGSSSSSPHCDLELERTSNPGPKYPSDPIYTGSRTAMSASILPLGRTPSAATAAAKKRRASFEANTIIWTYTKFSMMFLLALLVTWTPPTVNRVYNFVNSSPNFTLSYLSGLVVPLQGFWNSIIYIATSYPAVKSLFDISLLRRRRATPAVSQSNSENNEHPRSVLLSQVTHGDCRRDYDGATAKGTHELSSAHSRISANPTSTRGLHAVANARAHRSCSGGLAPLASKHGFHEGCVQL